MADDLQIDILPPDEIYGSTSYTITVRVTNTSSEQIDGVSVEPIVLAGQLLIADSGPEESTAQKLESEKRRLVSELERQVERAHERNRFRQLSFVDRVIYNYARIVEVYASLFTGGRARVGIPSWAHEALRIQEWADVERLEDDIVSNEREESFLRKAFMINKDKLQRCLSKLSEANDQNEPNEELSSGDSLPVGASLSYASSVRAPHQFRAQDVNLEFRLNYRTTTDDAVTTRSVSRKVTVRTSAFAVPTASMIGAAAGYGIRSTLAASANGAISFNWWHLGGSVLLGLVFALFTARRPGGKQAIAVEDFVGGFIIGALTGLFSQEVLERLGSVLK
ncbi:MAG: hypothetical protein HON53_09015 [Planctomycetaceae bacterium]|nr:hypothetical protein [Planctomycetaceae bacterium]MBT6155989.1 hypothetical protein [Planctomycetaceae bacterium]MBT6483504.1 hypothetical protein [Planctomycetaceae bacterium]MBT6494685.1 hypothetical protein [Planctomycetaceae bacterium]